MKKNIYVNFKKEQLFDTKHYGEYKEEETQTPIVKSVSKSTETNTVNISVYLNKSTFFYRYLF